MLLTARCFARLTTEQKETGKGAEVLLFLFPSVLKLIILYLRRIETFESFEECFEEAEEVWKNRNYYSFEIEEVMMVDSIHPSRFFPYFVFSNHFSDAERITKVMQMEKALYGNYNKKWLFEIMHFAINNDDEYAEKIFEKISKDVEEELIQLTEKKIAIKIPR